MWGDKRLGLNNIRHNLSTVDEWSSDSVYSILKSTIKILFCNYIKTTHTHTERSKKRWTKAGRGNEIEREREGGIRKEKREKERGRGEGDGGGGERGSI